MFGKVVKKMSSNSPNYRLYTTNETKSKSELENFNITWWLFF